MTKYFHCIYAVRNSNYYIATTHYNNQKWSDVITNTNYKYSCIYAVIRFRDFINTPIIYMIRHYTSIIRQLQYENNVLANNYNQLIERMNSVVAENDELKQKYKKKRQRNKPPIQIMPPPANTLYYISQPVKLSDENITDSSSTYSSITMSAEN